MPDTAVQRAVMSALADNPTMRSPRATSRSRCTTARSRCAARWRSFRSASAPSASLSGVPGVASVENRLRVWLTVSANDVADRVTDAIGRDAIMGGEPITVRVTGTDVVLSGAVTSMAHRDAAVAAAAAVPGVATVHDELTGPDGRAR